jgi:drug/metabolite transporter (DMT)-like permease
VKGLAHTKKNKLPGNRGAMTYMFIILTIAFTVAGQLALKIGMLRIGGVPPSMSDWPSFFTKALLNPLVFSGLILAVLAALSWMAAISRSDLSLAYPFMSLAIVLVLALSGLILGENVPINRWIGVIVVGLGILIAAS